MQTFSDQLKFLYRDYANAVNSWRVEKGTLDKRVRAQSGVPIWHFQALSCLGQCALRAYVNLLAPATVSVCVCAAPEVCAMRVLAMHGSSGSTSLCWLHSAVAAAAAANACRHCLFQPLVHELSLGSAATSAFMVPHRARKHAHPCVCERAGSWGVLGPPASPASFAPSCMPKCSPLQCRSRYCGRLQKQQPLMSVLSALVVHMR